MSAQFHAWVDTFQLIIGIYWIVQAKEFRHKVKVEIKNEAEKIPIVIKREIILKKWKQTDIPVSTLQEDGT
jgi:hypothetical protein